MTSTSLSSPPSIQRLIEDGSRLQLRTRAYRQWLAHRQPLERHRPHASHRLLMRHQLHARQPHCVYKQQGMLHLTSRSNSTTVAMAQIAASPSSISARGVTTSRVITSSGSSTLSRWCEKRPQHTLRARLAPLGPREAAWCSLHTFVWWSSHASSSPTCQRSMTGLSIPLSSYKSTPLLSLQ
jgi:hypothetical protein